MESRMTRALDPTLVREAALANGVCVRPIVSRVTDTTTGETELVAIACGSTREDRCPPCADRARRLRMHQCREGWHLGEEPKREGRPDDDDAAEEPPTCEQRRRKRSTRRRDDAPDLPQAPMARRTVGRVFTAPDGKTYRPSMFITLTLPSYGAVTAEGAPVDPDSYDYRQAALDALHFSKLVDRFWQNLRRCAGYEVQYFAAVEAQRRAAPHVHAALRGAIPRRTVRAVRAATYHQVWWPAHDTPVYMDQVPVWSEHRGYCDPETGRALPTWQEALDELDGDPAAEPAHVVRFGSQDDIRGLIAGTPGADRAIGYLCKYLTKTVAGTYAGPGEEVGPELAGHLDRLAEEVRWLPCSPRCANWLRFGVQPDGAGPGMVPGRCPSKAHERENLGLGGRRVLVSRRWSGKTLSEHRADRAAVVRAALQEAGIDPDDHNEYSISGSDGRWAWEIIGRSRIDAHSYAAAIAESVAVRQRWRRQYEAVKARAGPPVPAAA
jgi:hypothetical protein